jgi:hypothetical protein
MGGENNQPRKLISTPAVLGSAAPILGARRSLRQIPQAQKTKASARTPRGTANQGLLKFFAEFPAHCRELVRKRAFGFAKRSRLGKGAVDIEELEAAGLNNQQQDILRKLAVEVSQENAELLQQAWLIDYVEAPPTIQEFIRDNRFLGQYFRRDEGFVGLYPRWEELLDQDFDLDSEIHNLVLTGALGIGKTTALVVIILYRLCLVTMLQDPQKMFGMGSGSRLVFALLSVTKAVMKETAFHEALSQMRTSPYFRESCGLDVDAVYADCRVEMKSHLPDGRPCNVFLIGGSRRQDLLGQNVLGVALDEGNFRLEKDPDESAYYLYSHTTSRMANRFRKSPGYQPTISIVASSAGNEWSFTERVIKEIVEAKNPRAHLVYRCSIYDMKRHVLELDGIYFRVAYGAANCDPVVLGGNCSENGTPIGAGPHEPVPSGTKIEIVPRLYEDDYRRNCRAALQDFSGISAGGTRLAFPEMRHFAECINLAEADGLREPTRPGVTKIPVTMEDDLNIWDYLVRERVFTRQCGSVQPLRHPSSKRYVHIDLATRSTAGIAVCHLVSRSQPESRSAQYQLVVEYDFVLALVPGREPPIYLQKIVDFIFWLRDECGIRFGQITADQYQSEMLLQALAAQGLKTHHLSVDRDKSVYEAWRNGIEGHQIRLCPNDLLLREAAFLQELAKKFDHGVGGSKDLADAAAGAYFNAITSGEKTTLSAQNVPAVFGIQLIRPGSDAALTDFGILEDYMRRSQRPIRVFRA